MALQRSASAGDTRREPEQQPVVAARGNERETERTAFIPGERHAQLRQARKAGDAQETHRTSAKIVELRWRRVSQRRDGVPARQREPRVALEQVRHALRYFSALRFERRPFVRRQRRRPFETLAHAGTELRFRLLNPRPVLGPRFGRLQTAKNLKPLRQSFA